MWKYTIRMIWLKHAVALYFYALIRVWRSLLHNIFKKMNFIFHLAICLFSHGYLMFSYFKSFQQSKQHHLISLNGNAHLQIDRQQCFCEGTVYRVHILFTMTKLCRLPPWIKSLIKSVYVIAGHQIASTHGRNYIITMCIVSIMTSWSRIKA